MCFLCVPFAAQASTLRQLATVLSDDHVVVDCTVPLATAFGGRPSRLLGVPQGSAAEQARELLPPGVPPMAQLDRAIDEDVLTCGNDTAAKRTAGALEQIAGLRAVGCGKLGAARPLESLTPLLSASRRQ